MYGTVSTDAGLYATAFYDVTSGNDGSCSSGSAHTGYDQPSGLGTPVAGSLLSTPGASSAPPPVVSAATVKGTAGSALLFTMAASSSDPLSWSLANAPQGMSIDSSGQVTWAQPVAGTYKVSVTAKDTVTGSTGSASANVTIVAASKPVVQAATIVGQAKQPLSYQVDVSAADPVRFSLSGAPSGMSISSAGVISWKTPVKGTYSVSVKATDTSNGQSGSATMSVRISSAVTGPAISAAPNSGVEGRALSGVIAIEDPGASSLKVDIKGAPAGMVFVESGPGFVAKWARPVAGTYTVTLTAVDSARRQLRNVLAVSVAASLRSGTNASRSSIVTRPTGACTAIAAQARLRSSITGTAIAINPCRCS